jgi:hypothetical protein
MQGAGPIAPVGGFGMNQMLEMFKMQYLMKFLDGNQGQQRGGGSLMTMFVLLGYDQLVKYFPGVIQLIWAWIMLKLYGKATEQDKKEPLLLPSTQPPPATKSIKAFIQFERHPDKAADPRIDAVIYHVCNLPDVRSLRYNGVEMIPNFKDTLMIENDIWFEIINPGNPAISMGVSGKDGKQEPILYRLSTYDHDITWLHKFVDETIDRYEQEKKNKLGSETYYFDQMVGGSDTYRSPYGSKITMFTKSKFTSNRTLNNVYLKQIDELKQRVEFFMRRRDWYDSKGIPHTLGIVMYGVPGCGKTSTIKGIANETKRHIFNISLSEIKTKESLKDLFYNEQVHVLQDGKTEVLTIPLKHRLYVIEDIDAMDSVVIKRSDEQIKREEEKKIKIQAEMEMLKQTQGEAVARAMMNGKTDDKDKLDLATLLNVLDGVRETPGRIIVLSTNYPERLDEALLRPGRFDMMLEFEKHSCVVLQQHIEKHYDIKLTEKQLKDVMNPKLNKKWTPAEVSQILFRRIGDVDGAIRDLLAEDPAKLFKFSQMKQHAEKTTENPVEEKEDFSGTSLENLLETGNSVEDVGNSVESSGNLTENTVEDTGNSAAIPKNEIVSTDSKKKFDDWHQATVDEALSERVNVLATLSSKKSESSEERDEDWLFSGGGSTMWPDYPSKEQVEAEKAARPLVFQDYVQLERKIEEVNAEYKRKQEEIYGLPENSVKTLDQVLGKHLTNEQKLQLNKLNSKRDLERHKLQLSIMLNSPMFTNTDGYTAMNDNGLPSTCPQEGYNLVSHLTTGSESISYNTIHLAGPDEGRETTLDDFFPPPLEVSS